MFKKLQNAIPCKPNYCHLLTPTKLINDRRQELIKDCLYPLIAGDAAVLYITQKQSLNVIDFILQAYLMDADVIWFVSLREQNLRWLIHGTEMIGETATHFKISLAREKFRNNNTVCLPSSFVNTVISTALRLIVLRFELCSFHLSMSSGSFVTEACRVFRFKIQKRDLQV